MLNHLLLLQSINHLPSALPVLVALALRHLDRRLARHVRHQQIHQDVLAVARLLHRLQQQPRQPVRVHVVVVSMVERGARQHNRVVVRPFRRVAPCVLRVVPEMGARRIADDAIGEIAPHAIRKVQFVRVENGVLVQREDRIGFDEGVRIEALRDGQTARGLVWISGVTIVYPKQASLPLVVHDRRDHVQRNGAGTGPAFGRRHRSIRCPQDYDLMEAGIQ